MIGSPLLKKRVVLLLHIGFWTLLFGLPYLLRQPYGGEHTRPTAQDQSRFEILRLINLALMMGLFYLNSLYLLPRFYFQKKYNRYAGSVVLVLLGLSFINWISFRLITPGHSFSFVLLIALFLFPCLFVLAISTALAMFQDRVKTDRMVKERETETLKTELLFLRSQVSPHFLFNVLNNMVALARKRSDELEPSLIKLSSLLRYMLYEAAEEKVPLEKEVDYLKSYVDLQTQRFRKQMQVNVVLKEIDAPYEIEPMLLIPFVENAFKHGVTLEPDASIDIELGAKGGILQLLVRNKYKETMADAKDKNSGIGLNNVMRRLNLLYNNHHSLLINKNHNWFTVSLQLNLH